MAWEIMKGGELDYIGIALYLPMQRWAKALDLLTFIGQDKIDPQDFHRERNETT